MVECLIRCAKRENRNGKVRKPGRKEKLELLCHRRLIKYVRDNGKQPLFVITAISTTLDRTKLSARTIRSYLYRKDLRSYITASKLFLATKHIDARLI